MVKGELHRLTEGNQSTLSSLFCKSLSEDRKISIEAPTICDLNMAPGEGFEPSSSGSKPDVLPIAPSRIETSFGALGFEPRTLR